MSKQEHISGVANFGRAKFDNCAIGDSPTIMGSARPRDRVSTWDIGVIAIIPVEAQSVQRVLELSPTEDGFHTGERFARVVAVQADEAGEGDAADAARRLVDKYSPKMLALVGIGGGISPVVDIGDVVVATKVVYYGQTRDTPDGPRHRGRTWEAPVESGRAVNAFFTAHGAPAEFPGFKAVPGIIGSGDTVITAEDSETRKYLTYFNEKTLAVDMESDGLGQFCHKNAPQPWVVVRGISDDASERKSDDYQATAATNAAWVLRSLIPYLAR